MNNIDGVQGDGYVVNKRKDASRLVNRIFSKLDIELKILSESELQQYTPNNNNNNNNNQDNKIPLSYSIGVCIQQCRTTITIVYSNAKDCIISQHINQVTKDTCLKGMAVVESFQRVIPSHWWL